MTSHGYKQNEISQELSMGTKIFKTSYGAVLRLQDIIFAVLGKIANARSISVRFLSNFHQIFASACKIW
jgi:hypothetical protein